ncbi:MAG: phosphoethanolamine transferase [Acidaminococcales bacterium]|jgi:hypothetical protein|nr:phosphoethanolamine transferase [Acidaminococcales bacterium]
MFKLKNFIDSILSDLSGLSVFTIYFSCVTVFIYWALSFYMDGFAAWLLSAAALIFYLCGGKFLRALFLFVFGLSVLFQNHLVLHYSYPFAKIGREILVIASETTGLEFASYLQVIKPDEYMNFFWLLMVCFFTYKYTVQRERKKLPVLTGFFLLFFALWNDIGAPVSAFNKEMSENARIFERYKMFNFNAKDFSGRDKSTCIIIIGETHRHDYFDKYGYNKEYTPNLLKARSSGALYYFTDMISGFYYTTGSVPLILTRKPVECETRFYDEKSIISAFKEAGYATWSISYTKKTQPEDDAMNLIFLEADQYINHSEKSGTFDDVGMLPYIKDILADDSKRKKLIVVKMIGAHYLYEERYPKDFELYKPSYKSVYNYGEAANDLTLLKNSYKNAIAYSASFIDQLAAMAYQRPEPVLMSFISDHGASLGEDPAGGKYVGRAKGAYHIAFFITGNQPFWAAVNKKTRNNLLNRRHASLTQEYFLETYLALAGIEYFDPRLRFNIAGNGFEPAQNRIVWTGVGLEGYDYLTQEHPFDPSDEKALPAPTKTGR